MTDCPNPDAERAALEEALKLWSKWFIVPVGQRKGRFKIIADKTDALLANISPATKEILEKAQAHDAMKAELERLTTGFESLRQSLTVMQPEYEQLKVENERLRAALHRPQCPSTKAVEIVAGASQTYPSRRGRCSVCGYAGPVKDSGNLWRHSSQAALVWKEPE